MEIETDTKILTIYDCLQKRSLNGKEDQFIGDI